METKTTVIKSAAQRRNPVFLIILGDIGYCRGVVWYFKILS